MSDEQLRLGDYENVRAFDAGNDVLEVRAQLHGRELSARGWVSHLVNFYPPDAYGEDGHVKDGIEPRRATESELHAYVKELLEEAAGPLERRQLLGGKPSGGEDAEPV